MCEFYTFIRSNSWERLRKMQLELVVRAGQLDSVTRLVGVLHWNRSAPDSIPARKHKQYIVVFFATAPGYTSD